MEINAETNMEPDYFVHDEIYSRIKQQGMLGWGGNERIAHGDEFIRRVFEVDTVPLSGKLLELGCGEGHLCRRFAERGFDVTGIDISPTAIDWAKQQVLSTGIPGSFLVADLTSAVCQLPHIYDVIIDGNCLHCIIGHHRQRLLKKVHQALAPEGVFFVSSLCAKDGQRHRLIRDGHLYRDILSPDDLISELTLAGFSCIQTRLYERETFNHMTLHLVKATYG